MPVTQPPPRPSAVQPHRTSNSTARNRRFCNHRGVTETPPDRSCGVLSSAFESFGGTGWAMRWPIRKGPPCHRRRADLPAPADPYGVRAAPSLGVAARRVGWKPGTPVKPGRRTDSDHKFAPEETAGAVMTPGTKVEEAGSWARRLDTFQRTHRWAGLTLAVIYKFVDDQGTYQAALLTYYGFVSLFPLLLLAVTILGFADRQPSSATGRSELRPAELSRNRRSDRR
jgi:hypothetical protein